MKTNYTFKEICWTVAGIACAVWAIWALGKEGMAAKDVAAAAGIWSILIFMYVSSGDCRRESLQQGEVFHQPHHTEPNDEVKQLLTQKEKGGTQWNLWNHFMHLSIW